ncbi:MAG: tetratricopeptide repeat protein [Deltaproteobacteria bacterium]|nr:tetratricopeptide repeat protein [Deltaproteobacteria bacterium]
MVKNIRNSNSAVYVFSVIVISLVSATVYSNTFRSPFLFDDILYIVNNRDIRSFSNFWPPFGSRYIAYLSFAVNYHLGGLDTPGYHIFNFAVHTANGLLVFALSLITFRTPSLAGCIKDKRALVCAALLISLVFITHPVQTEAVTYISQRFASLAAFFYLASLASFAAWRTGRAPKAAWYALSLFLAVLAQMTKEISFTLPFVIALYDLVFFGPEENTKKRALRLVPFLAVLVIIPLAILYPEYGVETGANVSRQQAEEMISLSRYEYLITQFRVIVTYLRLLALPVGQRLDYDLAPFHSFFVPQVLLSFAFLSAVLGAALFLLVRSKKRGLPALFAFGVLWFFMTISIESSIIPIKDLVFEHRVYLPSVGAAFAFGSFSLTLASGVRKLKPGISASNALLAIALLCTVPLGAGTYLRNRVWASPAALWEDVVEKNSSEALGHINLANEYVERGRFDEAIEKYLASLKSETVFLPQTYFGLGNAYAGKGMAQEAEKKYREAIALKPDYTDARYNLGLLYAGQGRFDEGVTEFKEVLRVRPDFTPARINTGNMHMAQGRYIDAINEFEEALKIEPESAPVRARLGMAYLNAGRIEDSIEEFSTVIRLVPEESDAYYNLGVACLEKGAKKEAYRNFLSFLKLAPADSPLAHDARNAVERIKKEGGYD